MLIEYKDLYNITIRLYLTHWLYEPNKGNVLCKWGGSGYAKYWRIKRND